MAVPVINNVVAPASVAAGTTYTIEIHATDPSVRPVGFTATVTNTATGEVATSNVTVDVTSPGQLQFALATTDTATTISDGGSAGVFTAVSS